LPPKTHDIDETDLLALLFTLPVTPVHGQAERGDRRALRGGTQLRVSCQIPEQYDGVEARHENLPFTLKGQLLWGGFDRRLFEKRLHVGIGQHMSRLQGTPQP
jgi:hypothetical protein